jgi:hypothetical protein
MFSDISSVKKGQGIHEPGNVFNSLANKPSALTLLYRLFIFLVDVNCKMMEGLALTDLCIVDTRYGTPTIGACNYSSSMF